MRDPPVRPFRRRHARLLAALHRPLAMPGGLAGQEVQQPGGVPDLAARVAIGHRLQEAGERQRPRRRPVTSSRSVDGSPAGVGNTTRCAFSEGTALLERPSVTAGVGFTFPARPEGAEYFTTADPVSIQRSPFLVERHSPAGKPAHTSPFSTAHGQFELAIPRAFMSHRRVTEVPGAGRRRHPRRGRARPRRLLVRGPGPARAPRLRPE